MDELTRDLLAQGMELRETHISRVFLAEDTVYKVKKPVALGFLDFRTLAERKRTCEAEVTLNRRLAPRVYQRVVPITRDEHGVHQLDGIGEPVEYAVQMRRLPDADSVEARLMDGRLDRSAVVKLAAHVADFHAHARADAETARFGEPSAIEQNVRENFVQTRESAPRVLSAQQVDAIERWQLEFLHRHRDRFTARVQAGRVRDGHGDLRLEHCYLDDSGRVEIIDCIEFNERFRYGDVCADVAFLAMDFGWHGRADLSEVLLAAYAQRSGDYDLYGVVDFYESYRAYVRGKVSSMLADDVSAPSEVRSRAEQQARRYYLLAQACTRESLQRPGLYAVGGLIASGKTTVAEFLGGMVGAPVVDADRTRKQLAGVGVTVPLHDEAFRGAYSNDRTDACYAEVLRRAEVVLGSGRPVVVEASFRRRSDRDAARALAQRLNVPFTFIECCVDADTCRARLRKRATSTSISDGRLEVFDAFVASYEPVTELDAREHTRLDTTKPLDATRRSLHARLG